MPVTLTLQAAALAVALLMTGPASLQPIDQTPAVIRTVAPVASQHLHCRLYFGCAPVHRASAERARD